MNRKIIPAVAAMSLFGGLSMLAASAPAAAKLAPTAQREATESAVNPEKVALANTTVNTAIGLGAVAMGNNGSVAQSQIGQAGGIGNVGVATAMAAAHHFGGWKVAMVDVPVAAQADILFDND
ncbi:MAG: hypothetical protein QM820_18790 [Minicystis sp.]